MSTLPIQTPNYLYDLSNPHFENTELVLTDGKKIKGQFVQFRVLEGGVEYLYPSEKYCFVPEAQRKQFWQEFDRNEGNFRKIPSYIIQISMAQIKQISISPALVP